MNILQCRRVYSERPTGPCEDFIGGEDMTRLVLRSVKLPNVSVWSAPVFSVKGAVLAGLCLVTPCAPVNGAHGFTSDATHLTPPALTAKSDAEPWQFDESASVNPGGAIYNPFSTFSEVSTWQQRQTSATTAQSRHDRIEEMPDLTATTLAAVIGVGLLFYLFRALLTY